MTWIGRLLMTLLSLSLSQLSGGETPTQTLKSGEALFLALPCPHKQCTVSCDGHTLTAHAHPTYADHCLVILATPLEATSGNHKKAITIHSTEGKVYPAIKLTTLEPDYPVEPLSVNPDLVTPPEHALKRINKERKEIAAALKTQHSETPLTSAFIEPVPFKKITSPFGIRRLYNEQLKGRHTGVDLRAAEGTPVQAPHSGIVKMAQSNWYTGGHIVIEHGWGVSSSYFHLSDIQVKEGENVKQGQQIALTGATGRVTGPHLHWGVHIDSIPVNPVQFMNDTRRLFLRL
ncbi:M23 family metallopeptidase [Sansalvadorimonas verongulae]|uniref:M23 family metallopeptidase n=1 Tax=Sansalvadorimonas verongulae TaxID=2172824 RepID=UPI0012BD2EBA|nr:M23 family metallopeptidase [Sansalvadorimonas verongulae]MTI12550.1 M23 family metallopeptidase [Sansalvadorimonas verongulae]